MTGFIDRLFGMGDLGGCSLATSNVGSAARLYGLQNALSPYRATDMVSALQQAKSLLYEAHALSKTQRPCLTDDIWRVFEDAEAVFLESKEIIEQEAAAVEAALTAEYGPRITP